MAEASVTDAAAGVVELPPTGENKHNDGVAANSSAVRWESFLPKMMLRVLLVEADDSTRQIIAALLRKCSYRVAAVPDGLKAWEVLKRRTQNIDLILTEVDLPSISGFALLTLIMEHRNCKNIPVIMMSSQDSVSTVYKCMLRGAADFLVKPVRKNELRNLWQHVWRRQASSCSGLGPPDESVAQQKFEATAENNATSNCSSDEMACVQRSGDGVEKGADAQSSCTKPELEAEGAEMDCVQGLSHSKLNKPPRHVGTLTSSEHNGMNMEVQAYNVAGEGSRVAFRINSDRKFEGNTKLDDNWRCLSANNQASGDCSLHSSREAIDLIGTFDNQLECGDGSSGSIAGINMFDSLPLLDLSLRRSLPSGSVNQVIDERPRLNHSDASAFSRYVNKTSQPRHSTSAVAYNQRDNQERNSDNQSSYHSIYCNSDPCGPSTSSPRLTHLASSQPRETEIHFPSPQRRSLPAPIPVRGLRFQNINNAYGSLIPPALYAHSGMSQMQSPGSVNHQERSIQGNSFNPVNQFMGDPQPSCSPGNQPANGVDDQSEMKEKQRLEPTEEDRGHLSSATDQSANNSVCNGTTTHFHNLGCGNNGKLEAVPPVSTTEYGIEEPVRVHDANSLRSLQREAALTKFRLKRKERCFEKKVRYESRKKLAEKRPRVKGQFVRQVTSEPTPGKS